jgi:DNA invertase Pin-like site-specific DNA recombinase
MKTGVAYIRISKNESRSMSLDYQKIEVEKLAVSKGYKLISIESDNGISGKSMANRPGIQNVINMVNNKTVNAVICYRSDRISRNGLESIMFENLLNTNKIAYFSVTEGLIGDINEDPLMPWLRSGLNQRERMIISMRTKAALNLKRERGERLGGGIRYGQSIQNGDIIQNEVELQIVKRIHELHRQEYPTRAIAQILDSEGYRPRRGIHFHQTQIIRILKSA